MQSVQFELDLKCTSVFISVYLDYLYLFAY